MIILPISTKDICSQLEKSEAYLNNLASRVPKLIYRKQKPKKSGGYRTITSPNNELKDMLRLINEKILYQFNPHRFIFLRLGSSHVKMLSEFRNDKFLITADINDFYPSIYPEMVRKTLLSLGFDDSASKLLTRLMTSDHKLPQGFPTSSKIAALTLNPVMIRLDGLAQAENYRIGIYADNLVIGTNYQPKNFKNLFVRIFRQQGFLLDEFEIYCPELSREIMGIKITKNKLEVVASYIEKVKSEIENLKLKEKVDLSKMKSIMGKIKYIKYVNPIQSLELKRMLAIVNK